MFLGSLPRTTLFTDSVGEPNCTLTQEGGRGAQAKSRQPEDRPWRGQDDKGGDSWTGGGGGLQGLRGPIDAAVRPRWREEDRQAGPRRPDPR